MPLTRATVTRASRIMLPIYPIFSGWLGGNYLFTPRSRLVGTPVLKLADSYAPMPVWGALFLAVAVVLTFALVAERRFVYELALVTLAAMLLIWTAVFTVAIFTIPGSSPAGPAWPLLGIAACAATIRTLDTREQA